MKVYFCKLIVGYYYKKVVYIEKSFFQPVTLDKENNIVFTDYELTRLHKKIFTPKEQNKITKLVVDKVLFWQSDIIFDIAKDGRNKYNYEKFLQTIIKPKKKKK